MITHSDPSLFVKDFFINREHMLDGPYTQVVQNRFKYQMLYGLNDSSSPFRPYF